MPTTHIPYRLLASSKKPKNNFIDLRTLPYNKKLDKLANEKRKAGWLHEMAMWHELKHKKFLGMRFHRQQIIGNFIVDFYSPNGGVVIEADGKSHETKIEYDKKRDEYLRSLGLKVIHVKVKDIFENIKEVMKNIKEELKKKCDDVLIPSPRGVPAPQAGCVPPKAARKDVCKKATLG